MFPYVWPFEFNKPTNVLSFGTKPSYNLKRPFDPCFVLFEMIVGWTHNLIGMLT
jgi:hypothetical protein